MLEAPVSRSHLDYVHIPFPHLRITNIHPASLWSTKLTSVSLLASLGVTMIIILTMFEWLEAVWVREYLKNSKYMETSNKTFEKKPLFFILFLTWAGGSLDGSGDAVGAVLCDGLNGQLVLAHGGRLHYGDSL